MFIENKTNKEIITGYEKVDQILTKYENINFRSLEDGVKEKIILDVLSLIRSINIFPIAYQNDIGKMNDILNVRYDTSYFDGYVLPKGNSSGQKVCRELNTNLHKAVNIKGGAAKGSKSLSIFDKFYDDNSLKAAIKIDLNGNMCGSQNLFRALNLVGATPTNFKPVVAKCIFEYFTPEEGTIYDFSAGFGGRMMGCLTSTHNFNYIATDPCIETMSGNARILAAIEKTVKGASARCKLINTGSEIDLDIANESVDFSFSSPPYFNLERYSDEDTQCYNKYEDLKVWLDQYVKGTIKNIYRVLKQDRYYAVNIADFQGCDYVNNWKSISTEIGFQFVRKITLPLTLRRGVNPEERSEGVYLFKKGNPPPHFKSMPILKFFN